ncbi:MAG: hypothetical protein AAGK78_05505, partial [Planctomycetota bacterium]
IGLHLPPGSGTVGKVLANDRMSTREFLELDDVSVLGCFKQWATAGDDILARLCSGLLDRKLYKTIDGVDEAGAERARVAVGDVGGNPDYDLFHDDVQTTAYASGDPPIFIMQPDGTAADFADVSPVSHGLRQATNIRRLHVSAHVFEIATEALRQ